MHSIPLLSQLGHGVLLLHLTFLRRQVTQLREADRSCVERGEGGPVLAVAMGRLAAEEGNGTNEDDGSSDGAESTGVKDMTRDKQESMQYHNTEPDERMKEEVEKGKRNWETEMPSK